MISVTVYVNDKSKKNIVKIEQKYNKKNCLFH